MCALFFWLTKAKDQNIHISLAELRHSAGQEDEAVAFPDGSGYMAQLQVYHDLHCLVRLIASLWSFYWNACSKWQDYKY